MLTSCQQLLIFQRQTSSRSVREYAYISSEKMSPKVRINFLIFCLYMTVEDIYIYHTIVFIGAQHGVKDELSQFFSVSACVFVIPRIFFIISRCSSNHSSASFHLFTTDRTFHLHHNFHLALIQKFIVNRQNIDRYLNRK